MMTIYVIVKRTDFRLCMVITIILIPVAIFFVVVNFKEDDVQSPISSNNATNSTGPRAVSTLQLVIVASRHGNRPPLDSFPTWAYPKNNSDVWPYGADTLTELGRVKTYRLGVKLRSLYDGFMDRLYYPKDYLMHSTLTDRTLQSSEEILAGLFPPTGFQLWNRDLAWQPIPVYPTYLEGTHLWDDPRSVCPRYRDAQTQAVAQFDKDYAVNITTLMRYLQDYTGIPQVNGSHNDLYTVWDCLISAENQRLPLPEWSTLVFPEPMTTLITKLFVAYAYGSENMTRLFQGPLFQQMMGLMEDKVNGTATPGRRMVHYSGHDTTILGLQAILGMPQAYDTVVKTGSALIFELHKSAENNVFYIEVLYIDGNSTDLEPVLLDIPGCHSPCDFYTLQNITEKYYNITDYKQECQAS